MNVIYTQLKNYQWNKPTKGHPLFYFMEENRELEKILEKIKKTIQPQNISELRNLVNELKDFEKHYLRKENLLFPYLEKKWENFRCLQLHWSLHDDIRKKLKELTAYITDKNEAKRAFERLMSIEGCTGVLVQPMLSGTELFIGAKYEEKFGHLLMFGLGGIFVEVFKDVIKTLAPVGKNDVLSMLKELKSYKFFEGVRGKEPVSAELFAEIVTRISALLKVVWLFDRPVSNSGRIAALVQSFTERIDPVYMEARAVERVDALLKECDGVVATADSEILDSGVEWFDMVSMIAEESIPEAKIIDLSDKERG
jgi:hypothetical protein